MLLKLIFLVYLSFTSLSAQDFFNTKVPGAEGGEISFSDFKGHTLLVINIATRCGFTGQLDDLEKLYQKYKERGLKMLAIPTNNFRNQTPESNEEVAQFCRLRYGVTFPIAEKMEAIGDQKHDVFKFLTRGGREIRWNFEKFLINKDGQVVERFSSMTKPLSRRITSAIEKHL